jgi:hypothetical protein
VNVGEAGVDGSTTLSVSGIGVVVAVAGGAPGPKLTAWVALSGKLVAVDQWIGLVKICSQRDRVMEVRRSVPYQAKISHEHVPSSLS